MNPKYRIFPRVDSNNMRNNKKIANTKAIWDKMIMAWDKEGKEKREEKETPKTIEAYIMEQEHREVWNRSSMILDGRKLRTPYVAINSRVMIPKGTNVLEEAELALRDGMMENVVNQYLMMNPDAQKDLTA